MEEHFGHMRTVRAAIKPEPSHLQRTATMLEHKIADWERAIAGDRRSEKYQELTIQINQMKDELLNMKRRMAGRTPEMKSWADPL